MGGPSFFFLGGGGSQRGDQFFLVGQGGSFFLSLERGKGALLCFHRGGPNFFFHKAKGKARIIVGKGGPEKIGNRPS